MLTAVLATWAALRALPALASRVSELEARSDLFERTAGRVADLENNLDEVEALAREINVAPRAMS
jgi:hypothetical protein